MKFFQLAKRLRLGLLKLNVVLIVHLLEIASFHFIYTSTSACDTLKGCLG